jgi:hypothetical protein
MNKNPPNDVISREQRDSLPPHQRADYVPVNASEVEHLADKTHAYRQAWIRLPYRTRLRMLAQQRDLVVAASLMLGNPTPSPLPEREQPALTATVQAASDERLTVRPTIDGFVGVVLTIFVLFAILFVMVALR